jgi:ATP-binding cassette subfamily C protein
MFSSFFKLLIRCYRLALPYGRFKLTIVLGTIFFNGLLQLVGVTSIFPFFALCAEPDRIRNSRFGTAILHFLPPMSVSEMLVLAGIASITMLLLANLGSIVSEVIRIRYAFGFAHWLRKRVFESYAERPYGFFLLTNSAELGQKLGDAMTFVQSVLLPLGESLTRIVLIVFLVGTIFLVQPGVALGGIVILGGFYFFIFIWMRPKTREIADITNFHSIESGKNIGQFLGGIKAVKVHGKAKYFMNKALFHSSKIGRYQAKIPMYSNGPRYMIEPIAYGGLVSVVLFRAMEGRPFSDILPNLSVIALAAMRLLPALQLLYTQLVTISANSYTLQKLEDEILQIEEETESLLPESSKEPQYKPVKFDREITLEKISFQYPDATFSTLVDFSLDIHKNESLGIAGPSGSGKSTLVDVLLGLHIPQSGVLSVDGIPLSSDNMPSWRKMIGYVPQDIYLLDDSIQENIAFGIAEEDIDPKALREAAQGAQILEFIENELPHGFQTTVGERGVRLSGGQRQRIGLARALYHKPQILILDEATSALDTQTELAVMETIHRLQGTLTIITIAHRLSTLEKCDRVIQIGKSK